MKRGEQRYVLLLVVLFLFFAVFAVQRSPLSQLTGAQVAETFVESSSSGEEPLVAPSEPASEAPSRSAPLVLAEESQSGSSSDSGAGISGGIGISTDITTCQNLAVTDTYALTQNVSSQSNCFNISANNVTLNCQGNTILYANATEAVGIFVNAFNVSVLNCRLEQINASLGASHGVRMSGADRAIVMNNTVITNGTSGGSPSNALSLVGGTDHGLFMNNTFVALSAGTSVAVDSSINNTFYQITAFANSSGGFGFTSASTDNRVWNSYAECANVNSGVAAAGSSDNLSVVNSTFVSGTGSGISLISSNSHTLSNNTVSAPFGLQIINSASNTMSGNRLASGVSIGVRLFGASTTGNVLTNTTIETNNTWIFSDATTGSSTSFTNTTFRSVSGDIRILPAATVPSGANVSVFSLNTSSNNSFLNSTNLTFLNLSGQVVLRSVFFNDPSPLVDAEDDGTFVNCSSPTCAEVSYSGGEYVFNVSGFTSYAATGVPMLLDCANLDSAGEYFLAESVSAGGDCFNITADNVSFDCAGFEINYSTATAGIGINATGRTNVTIRNCTMRGGAFTGSHGVLFSSTMNSQVIGSVINASGDSASPIRLTSSSINTIANNSVYALSGTFSSTGAIYLSGGSNNDVSGNTALSNGSSGFYLDGASSANRFVNNYGVASIAGSAMTFTGGGANNVTNVTAIASGQPGILMTSSTGNRFWNSRMESHGHVGFFAAASALTYVDNSTALSNGSQAILMLNSGSSSINGSVAYGGFAGLQFSGIGMGASNVSNSLLATNGTSSGAVSFFGDFGSNQFRNVTLMTNRTWILNSSAGPNNNFTNITFNSTNGSIRFNGTFTLNGTVNVGNLSAGQGFAFVNTTNVSFLNTTAQVSLANVSLVLPRIKVDLEDDGTFVSCPASVCTQVSYSANTFVFNVSRFTNYSLSEAALNYCPVTINESMTLTQNVSSLGTCVTFGADNIELDCGGYTITYGNTSVGNGINATGRKNVSAANCVVLHGGTLVDSSAIFFSGTNESSISNVTAMANGSTSNGIELMSSHNNSITHGLTSSNDTGSGVRLQASSNNTVRNVSALAVNVNGLLINGSGNTITNVSGVAIGGDGIAFVGGGENVLNSSRASSGSGSGISLSGEVGDVLTNNAANSSTGSAIFVNTGSRNLLENNQGNSSTQRGIAIQGGGNNTLVNNTGVSVSNIGLGVLTSHNNTLVNNTGENTGGGAQGIDISSSNENNLTGNRGVATTAQGLQLTTSNNNILVQNTGVSASSSGILLSTASMNNLSENNGSSASFYGIQLTGGAFNRVERGRATSVSNDGVYLTGGSAQNVLENNTFQSDTDGAVGFGAAGSQNNNFTNNTLQSNVSWIMLRETSTTGNVFRNTFFDTVGGVVQIQNFTLPNDKNVTFVSFNISQNRTFLNSSNLTFLNQSANITLRNISFGNPRAVVDENDTNIFITCPSGRCTPISYSGGAFTFNVSGFTSYAVSDAGGVALTKSDSPDPVVKGALLTYQIVINNTNNVSVFNVSLSETYPSGVSFVSSSPVPSAGNNTFSIGTLAANTSTTINITVRAGGNLANGTVLNNAANISSRVANGSQSQANVSEQTAVRGIASLTTTKTDTPDPVPRGTTIEYQITVTNTGDEIAYNTTVVEGYPANSVFNGSVPPPSSGNNTFIVGDLLPGQSTTINITINASSALANASLLTNNYNVTFANVTGANQTVSNSTTTTVLGSPNLSIMKTDSPDPVFAGDTLAYTINVTNNGDDTAFNVTVIEGYPAGVSFVSGQPTPIGNNTFSVGTLAPSASFLINITVTVGGSLPNGTILNNTVNASFTNRSGQTALTNTSELTTVIGSPFLTTNKTANQSVVVKGQTVNYTITVNNTGTSAAFNVTVIEGYPAGMVFITSQPAPTSGNGTFNVGTLLPNQSTTINITLNTSVTLANGTVLNNSYNTTLNRTDGRSVNASSSVAVTIQGIPTIAVTKFDSPDPVLNGSQLNYTIAVTNTGDEIAYNITVIEGYDPNVVFHNSSPAPTSGNNVFALGNLLPGQTTTLNITVNVSPTYLGLINNSVNVTFTNLSGVNETVAGAAQTNVVPRIGGAGQGGGSGGSGSGSGSVSSVTSMTSNFLSMYLRKNDKVKFTVSETNHEMTVLEVLVDAASVRVASVPQEFIIRKGAVQAVDVSGDGQADMRISVSDVVYDRALFLLEKTALSPVKAEYAAPEVKEELQVPAAVVEETLMPESDEVVSQADSGLESVQGQALRPEESQSKSLAGLFAIGFAVLLAAVIGVTLFSGRRTDSVEAPVSEPAPPSSRAGSVLTVPEVPKISTLVSPPRQAVEMPKKMVGEISAPLQPPKEKKSTLRDLFMPAADAKKPDLKLIDAELSQLRRKIKKLK